MTLQDLRCSDKGLPGRLRRLRAFAMLFAVTIAGIAHFSVSRASSDTALPSSPSAELGQMCKRGYENQLGVCVAIKIPPHAYLDASGDFWECMRGYRELDQRCSLITVPPHGHLTDVASDRAGYATWDIAIPVTPASRCTCRRTPTEPMTRTGPGGSADVAMRPSR